MKGTRGGVTGGNEGAPHCRTKDDTMLKRIGLLTAVGVLCVSWAGAAQAQCIVDTSTPTYANGEFLRYHPCDANGNVKVTGGGGGGGAATIADGADVALGATTDAATTAGGAGTVSAKLRNATELLDTNNTTLSTLNAKLPSAALMAEDSATPTLSAIAVYPKVYDGTDWDFLRKADSGAGSVGSATQRVVIAYDSGVCNAKNTSQLAVSVSSSGNNELVALTSAQTIYVCDLTLIADGAVDVQLIYGTGTACGTGETNMSGVMKLTAAGSGWTHDYGGRLKTAEANALCLELSGAVAVNGILTYRKAATF